MKVNKIRRSEFEIKNKEIYTKMINATEVFRLDIENITGKLKVGQNLSQDRFNMVLNYLEKRRYNIDKETVLSMNQSRKK